MISKKIAFLFLIIFLGLIQSNCKNKSENAQAKGLKKERVITVRLAEAKKKDFQLEIKTLGSFLPSKEVKISATLPGKIKEIKADKGDKVKKGMLLARLEEEDYLFEVRIARNNLKEAEARLARLKSGTRKQQIKTAEARVNLSKANLKNSRQELERKEKLFQEDAVSLMELEKIRTLVEVNKATLQADTEQLALLKEGNPAEEIRGSSARLNALKTSLELAEKKLKDLEITSPISGVVKEKLISQGEFAGVGIPLFTIIALDTLKFEASVSERELNNLRLGQEIEIKVDAYPEKKFTGKINFISPEMDPISRNIIIEADIPNSEGLLKPGLFGRAKIRGKKLTEILVIPRNALLSYEEVNKVFILEGNRAKSRSVQVGRYFGGEQEIVSGLQPGEKIVVSGQRQLSEGDKVVVK